MNVKIEGFTLEKNILLNAVCMDISEGEIWFIHNNYPFLFCFDLERKKVTLAKVIPINGESVIASFSSIHVVGEKIYLIPNNARDIFVYYRNADEYEKLFLNNTCPNMFRDSYLYDNYIYCIPYRYDKIVKVNLVLDKITYINIDKDNYIPKSSDFCINSVHRNNNCVVCVVWKTDYFIEFNLENEKINFIKGINDGEKHSLSRMCIFKNRKYIYDMKRVCYILNKESEEICKSVTMNYEDALIIPNGEVIIIDPIDSNSWQIVDQMLNLIADTHYDYEVSNCDCPPWKIGAYVCDGEFNLYRIGMGGELTGIRKDGSIFIHEFISIEREKWSLLIEELVQINKNYVIKETNTYCVNDFLNKVIEM